MANSPSIVMASLSDDQLKKSIDSLVTHVDEAMKKMVQSTNNAVGEMEAKLKSLGNLKIDSGGSADGGASKRAKAQNAETDAVEKNIAARDKQIKKNQEAVTSFDNFAKAQQVAIRSASPSGIRNADTLQTMNIQLDLLRERLREARQQYSSFVALAAHATTTGDKGLFQYATDGVHRYEQEVRNLIPQIRTLQSGIQQMGDVIAPQGHTIQNYVNSLQKANPELAALNAQYKSGTSLLQDQSTSYASATQSAQRYTEEIRKQLAAITSKKDATKAFEQISLMPSNTMDEIKAKGQALVELVKKVKDTPLMSQSNVKLAEKMIGSLANQYRALKEEKEKVANTQTINAAAENTTRRSLEQEKQDLERLKALQEERRQQIIQTGIAAQQQARIIRESIGQQMQSADYTKQVDRVKELQNALTEMKNAYKQPIDSSIKKSLEEDIAITQKALDVAKRYNMTVAGLGAVGIGGKAPTDTLAAYSAEAQRLAGIYKNLSTEERSASAGQGLKRKYQELSHTASQVRKELERPINLKDAMKGGESTIDDLAYKIQRLQSYKRGLDFKTQAGEIQEVDNKIKSLNAELNKYLETAKNVQSQNTALGRSWNYMKNRLAFYFTVGASTSFIKNLIEVRSQYEMNERALGILVNSAERGTQIFNELSQMALVSPYTLIELSAAAKQLTAYDVAANDVVDTTRRLADMAAAVGIPIERLTYALGQIKAYGYLNARDARMFANAGIPLVKQLSEYYTELEGRLVSTADIYDRIKKKSIGYEEVTSVIAKMTDEGGKFYDFQAKMAETLKVQLANLTLAWNNMLNAMGEESQGVLVGGISTLKQVFLHWKDIEHVLYELVVALGAYKAYQIITTRLMGATAASLDAQVLAMKRNKAAMLEKQALTRKLTVDELRQVAAQNELTMSDYKNALSGKNLTKQKALLLIALNRNNFALKSAIINMGLLTATEANNITTGKALAIVFKSIGISIKSAALAIKSFMASMWPLLVIGAIYELYHAWDSYGEHVKEINKQAAEHAKEAFENIKQYLESDVTSALQDRLAKGGKVESDAAGQKAWDEMREKIELSSSASNAFIAKLMQINDINERLSAGFGYLEDVQKVAGVMQTLEEDAVNTSSTVLGGLFGEGLKDDLADFINAYQKYVSLNENLRQSGVGEEYFNDQKRALEEFRGEVEKTTTSLYNVASKEGFNTNEQREFFEREISEIAQAEQMGAKETRIFRMQAEKEYYAYARAQLVSQLEYQDGAQKALTQKRINDLDNEFGTSKAMQESFFTWLTEKQDHAVKNMLRGKTQEEIKQGEWLKGSNAKWVEEMARKFSKEYGVSFDDLHRLVLNANTWSINIPVFFQTIGQPLSDVQRDYEARTGKKFSSNALIKDAKTQVDIIDTLKKKQKEVANEMETARKAGGKYWEDNKQRYKEENDALVADIHAYNALTDAEEKANKKRGKGGSKKDPLLDALKQEISLVEKLQSDYDKLSKSGASQAEALETIRGAYGKTIRLLNAQLGKYGLPQLDISQLITGKDPNKTLAHFKQTLDTLVSKGMLTLERSKELEAVVEKFTLSAKTYNLDMITKGLNNELGKLKDEYELAVELDANPELGGIFADMMGLDKEQLSQMPKDFEGVVERLQKIIDRKLGKGKFNLVENLNKASFNSWLNANKQGTPEDDALAKSLESIIDYSNKVRLDSSKKQIEEWNKLLEKYAEYEYKVTQIQKEAEREREIARKKGASQEIIDAITERERQELAKLSFEEFQKTPEWIVATGDLANMSKSAIGMLIEQLEKYKHSAKNLSPKQIKQLNSALSKLYKEQRKNNPFKAISNMLDEAKERMATFDEDIKKTQEEIDKLTKKKKESIVEGVADEETDNKLKKAIKRLKELKEARENTGKVDASSWVSSINETIGAVQSAIGVFDDLAKAIGGVNGNSDIGKVLSVLESAGSAAAIGAQIGGAWGAVIGGVVGAATSLVSIFAGASNKKITSQIEESERAVKRLENAYKNLEFAIENAYGANVIGAKEAAIENKKLQLAELQRQLALEKSRDGKDRDEDKIVELQGQIIDLQNEIKKSSQEIVNDLLGISSVADAAMQFADTYIEALRKGEDANKAFQGSFKEMIANMIKQIFVAEVIGPELEKLVKGMRERIANRSKKEAEDYQRAVNEKTRLSGMNGKEILAEITGADIDLLTWDMVEQRKDLIDAYVSSVNAEVERTKKELDKATIPTIEDMNYLAEGGKKLEGELGAWEDWYNGLLDMYGLKDTTKNLSALQQGIQGITEDTAGALEGITNGISQQVYLHSDLLTQIRDAVVGIDIDVQVATQAQMLLQLQQSYQVQMSIESILQGVLVPSGRAFAVELLS